ncbi:hypothetical protein QR680_015231 [Steinernema hermaphroditum]|uniref:Uncharacterized protein n=1 Tax=Steinernema hermaphroditum TaxID=289476 RepID=A0AA39LKH3_9BILA|nr:hypothetical protein QR680_015231 [Steinernema hermaphroditum]
MDTSMRRKAALETNFKNRTVVLNEEARADGYQCEPRDLTTIDDYHYSAGEWVNIDLFKATQEAVEVKCGKDLTKSVEYNMLHYQFIERRDTNERSGNNESSGDRSTSDSERPNVYVIVFDSTSTPFFLRSMPKTLRLMTERHEAITFPFANKVGMNSRPNAWAFMFGRWAITQPWKTMSFSHVFYTFQCIIRDYMSAYGNQSKLLFMWNTNLAHAYFNGLHRADEPFYNVLNQHEARLNNSFVFIIADHGLRYGAARDKTKQGELEDCNPLLMISVPDQLRRSPLIDVLKENARKLVTHYDTYASLMDLAQAIKKGTLKEFANPKRDIFKAGHGSSYFRQSMMEPRDCGSLRIPYEYCLCHKDFHPPLDASSTFARRLAEYVLSYLETVIDEAGVSSKCFKMSILHDRTVVEKLNVPGDRDIYRITMSLWPSSGRFSGYVEVDENGSIYIVSPRFERARPPLMDTNEFTKAKYVLCHFSESKIFKGKIGFLLAVSISLLAVYILMSVTTSSKRRLKLLDFKTRRFSSGTNGNTSFEKRCVLHKLDPFDPEIMKYNDPAWKPPCDVKQSLKTNLKNRTVVLNEEARADGYQCEARDLTTIDDYHYSAQEAVEVKCGKDLTKSVEYNMLHYQFIERRDTNERSGNNESSGDRSTSDSERPNVYVIVFDSTSTPFFLRSMPKTLRLMTERHEAITFPFANKVGMNSRPNAWAFMFGKQISQIASNPYSDEILPDLHGAASCAAATDGEKFWMREFREMGYHTAMENDLDNGAINWPNCTGFKQPPAKHYKNALFVRSSETEAEDIRRTQESLCHYYHQYRDQFNYLSDYMSAYGNQSKLLFMWNTNLHHVYFNGLHRADEPFYNVLSQHEARLNNSFVFIMGDHGLRHGAARDKTKQGEIEDCNPFLMISVPYQFRRSPLMNVLKENARKLVTQYDTYASLMDLAQAIKKGTLKEFANPKRDIFKAGHGSSYFRQSMMEPRDCGSLRIPYEYCLCHKDFHPPLDASSAFARRLAEYVLSYLETVIDEAGVSSKCFKMSILHDRTVVEKLNVRGDRDIYRITISLWPSSGRFSGYVEVDENGSIYIVSPRFERVTRYDNQGECVEDLEESRPTFMDTNESKEEKYVLCPFYESKIFKGKIGFLLAVSISLLAVYILMSVTTSSKRRLKLLDFKTRRFSSGTNGNASFEKRCVVHKLDPFDPEIRKYNDPAWKPPCDVKQSLKTNLKNRTVVLNEEARADGYQCEARDLTTIDDYHYSAGEWVNIDLFKATQEAVEVKCGKDLTKSVEYNMLHYQFIERRDTNERSGNNESSGDRSTSDSERPNVYVIMFDSTSTPSFLRSMPKTLRLMTERHEAITFPFVNKVGMNSRPNAWAFMFGKQISRVASNPYSDEVLPDLDGAASCAVATDDEKFWMREFREMGYHTAMENDWDKGAVNWPNCTGFKKPPAKHYKNALFIRSSEPEAEDIRRTQESLCHYYHQYKDQFNYLSDYMSAYGNQSKLLFMWNTNLHHVYFNGLHRADEPFYNVLSQHEARLNNSFVFIMGDHGLRHGAARDKTKQGEIEDCNPFLMISVPYQFRRSPLADVLKENARKLVTQYDTYASLMDLAQAIKKGTLKEFANPKRDIFKAGHGSSYFRQSMMEPRDCGSLRIPYEYCLCHKDFHPPLDASSAFARRLAEYVLSYLETVIDEAGVSSKCFKMSILHDRTVVEKLNVPGDRDIYRITISLWPSSGRFSGYVEVDENGSIYIVSPRFERVTRYDNQGECVEDLEEVRPVCYCKNWENLRDAWIRYYFD